MDVHDHNKKELKPLRKALRRESTPQEDMLWSKLRASQMGVRFRRQHSVGNFILDFYCPTAKLAVELDGSQHAETEEKDVKRTEYLEREGIRVLRFWNNEVNTKLVGVLETIYDALQSTSTSPQPSPGKEREPAP